jgi:small-conductance mechanosensitive channel
MMILMLALAELPFGNWVRLWAPLAIFVLTVAIGYVAKRTVVAMLRRWQEGSASKAPAAIIQSLQGTFMLWVLILAVALALQNADFLSGKWRTAGTRILAGLLIFSLTLVAMRLVGNLIRFYGPGVAEVLPVTTLTRTLAQIAIAILGLVILLNQLGLQIAPILTALGVGGLAVALALQDTLGNLFAGFYIAVAGQIRVGDYIRLDSGQEGYVTDINWRNTSIRALANNLIIVPNSKLSQAIVTNFHFPEKRMSIGVNVPVDYGSDPDYIEGLLMEEAAAAAKEVPGLLAEPGPSVRLIPGFADSALIFSVNLHVAEFVDQYPVQHELRKRILRRFHKEGIEIPYPGRTVYLREAPPAGDSASRPDEAVARPEKPGGKNR